MITNHSLYEINTRVWLRRFDSANKRASLDDVPTLYWKKLAEKGIDYLWLMGIWKTCKSTVKKYCLKEGPVKESFSNALKDWQIKDVIGSPYAIDRYEVNPLVGTKKSLIKLKSLLNKLGIKLILDFVPNHFSADSSLIKIHPNIFLKADLDFLSHDSNTYYKPFENDNSVFAHGRDQFYPAWEDTIQVNYFSNDAREFMLKILMDIAKLCDGVRSDMAMLCLNNVFQKIWDNVLSKKGYKQPTEEFWKDCIRSVKDAFPEFLFIAEAYWDLEWELQKIGFDYTYDKKLTDRLIVGCSNDIREHLLAETDFQKKSVRFIENHDEERAITVLGAKKSKAAAIVIGTLQGMRLYHDGQFEGKKIRLPVQLGREPIELLDDEISDFYNKLFKILNNGVFKNGLWSLVEVMPSWHGDDSYQNILAWSWKYTDEKRLVIVNYADTVSTCLIRLDMKGYPEEFTLYDVLNNQTYVRSSKEAYENGVFIKLQNFHSHIFSY